MWTSSLLLLLFGLSLGALSLQATGSTAAELDTQRRVSVASGLEKIDGLPQRFVEDYRADGRIDEDISDLPGPMRQRVREIQVQDSASSAGKGLGILLFLGGAGFVVTASLGTGFVGLILGLILSMKRKIWLCECGALAERA